MESNVVMAIDVYETCEEMRLLIIAYNQQIHTSTSYLFFRGDDLINETKQFKCNWIGIGVCLRVCV